MDTRCRIQLRGGLRVQQGDRVVTRFRTRKAAALHQYQEFAHMLHRELGEAPSAALREFVQNLPPPPEPIVLPPVREHASRARSSARPPSGTLTSLLIELLGEPEESYAPIRREAKRHRGYEVEYALGPLALVFCRAGEALTCAVAAHRAVSEAAGAECAGGPVVRMALDTREADLSQDRERSAAA